MTFQHVLLLKHYCFLRPLILDSGGPSGGLAEDMIKMISTGNSLPPICNYGSENDTELDWIFRKQKSMGPVQFQSADTALAIVNQCCVAGRLDCDVCTVGECYR